MRFVEKYILTEKLIECIIVYNNTAIQIYMMAAALQPISEEEQL